MNCNISCTDRKLFYRLHSTIQTNCIHFISSYFILSTLGRYHFMLRNVFISFVPLFFITSRYPTPKIKTPLARSFTPLRSFGVTGFGQPSPHEIHCESGVGQFLNAGSVRFLLSFARSLLRSSYNVVASGGGRHTLRRLSCWCGKRDDHSVGTGRGCAPDALP